MDPVVLVVLYHQADLCRQQDLVDQLGQKDPQGLMVQQPQLDLWTLGYQVYQHHLFDLGLLVAPEDLVGLLVRLHRHFLGDQLHQLDLWVLVDQRGQHLQVVLEVLLVQLNQVVLLVPVVLGFLVAQEYLEYLLFLGHQVDQVDQVALLDQCCLYFQVLLVVLECHLHQQVRVAQVAQEDQLVHLVLADLAVLDHHLVQGIQWHHSVLVILASHLAPKVQLLQRVLLGQEDQ